MALALFGLWMLLEGRWTVETVLTGIVLSALIWLFCWKFLDYSPRREWAFIRRIPRALVYLTWLIGQVFIAGFRTMSRIWSGREVHPHLISFRLGRLPLRASFLLTHGPRLPSSGNHGPRGRFRSVQAAPHGCLRPPPARCPAR